MAEAAAATTTAATTTETTAAAAPAVVLAPTTVAATGGSDWIAGITDEATRNWVTAKGFKDPANLATSALNLEKLTGDMNSIVKLPKGDDATEWGALYDKLGRPPAPADYKLPVPEGVDPAFSNTAAGWFHEAGLNAKQGQALAAKWSEHMTAAVTAQQAAANAEGAKQVDALKVEWGAAFQANSAIVDRAATAFGMTSDQVNGLKAAMGPAAAMKFLHNIGSKIGGDDAFVTGAGGGGGGFQAMTPAAAKGKIAELTNDSGFVAKYAGGDVAAREEFTRLHKFAYPEG
jgi:hypothetical protein